MKTISKHIRAYAAGVATVVVAVLAAGMTTGCEKQGKYLEATPLEIKFTYNDDFNAAIRVRSSASWMSTTGAAWLTCTYENDGNWLRVKLKEANTSPDERRDIIDISSADGQTVRIVVIQDAAPGGESGTGTETGTETGMATATGSGTPETSARTTL
jgi:hypothetical protein